MNHGPPTGDRQRRAQHMAAGVGRAEAGVAQPLVARPGQHQAPVAVGAGARVAAQSQHDREPIAGGRRRRSTHVEALLEAERTVRVPLGDCAVRVGDPIGIRSGWRRGDRLSVPGGPVGDQLEPEHSRPGADEHAASAEACGEPLSRVAGDQTAGRTHNAKRRPIASE